MAQIYISCYKIIFRQINEDQGDDHFMLKVPMVFSFFFHLKPQIKKIKLEKMRC